MADIEAGDILISIRGDASQLEEEIERARMSMEGLEDSAGEVGDSMGGMGGQANKANTALKGMSRGGISGVAAGMRVMNPEMGLALTAIVSLKKVLPVATAATTGFSAAVARLGTAFKSLYLSLGPIGALLLAAIAIYQSLEYVIGKANEELDEQNKQLEINFKLHEKVNQANASFEQLQAQVARKVDLATGALTEEAAALLDFNAQADRVADGLIAAIDATDLSAKAFENAKNEIRQNAQALKDANELAEFAVGVQDELTASTDRSTAAIKRRTEALKKQAEAEKTEAKKAKAEHEEIILTAEESKDAITAGAIAQMGALAMASSKTIEEFNRTNETVNKGWTAAIAANARDYTTARAAFSLETFNSVGQASADISRELADEHSKASKVFFRISQAQAITDIAMNTAVGVSKALAQLGPIAGAVASIAVGAIGATQAGIVMSQSPPEHLGTSDALMPDERMSFRRTQNQEITGPGGTVNSMGSSMVSDLNRGRFPSGGGAPVTAVIGRTHLDQELFKNGRRGTSRYSRQLRRNPHPKQNGGW